MFIEFLADWGAYKVGEIPTDRSVFSDGICRQIIADGHAREVDVETYIARSVQAETAKAVKAVEEAARANAGAGRGAAAHTPAPPTGGLNFQRISDTSAVASDEVRNLCFADAMRCVFLSQAHGVDPGLAQFGRQRLRHYMDEVRRYEADPNTGEIRQTIERNIGRDGKGLEVITRDGTDSVSGGASYGFTLKPNYIDSLFKIARGQEVFAPATRKIPVGQGNEVKWPALGQYSAPKVVNGIPYAAAFGGITLAYKGEVAPRVSADAATEMITYKIIDLTGLTKFSRDYIVDNYIAMDSEVVSLFGGALAFTEDYVTMFGDGVAKPEGFLNSAACLTRNRNTSSHIVYEDITYMMSRLTAGVWRQARWLTSQTTMPELMSVKDASGVRVFLPNALVAQADEPSLIAQSTADGSVNRPMGTLMGLPVYFSEFMPTLGNKGDLCLVAPSQYGLAQRSGIEVAISDQVYFETDEIGYRFKLRHDGRSLWRAPYIQADNPASPGSGTQVSPFIVLV